MGGVKSTSALSIGIVVSHDSYSRGFVSRNLIDRLKPELAVGNISSSILQYILMIATDCKTQRNSCKTNAMKYLIRQQLCNDSGYIMSFGCWNATKL